MTACEWECAEHVCSQVWLSMWEYSMHKAYKHVSSLEPQPVAASAYDCV